MILKEDPKKKVHEKDITKEIPEKKPFFMLNPDKRKLDLLLPLAFGLSVFCLGNLLNRYGGFYLPLVHELILTISLSSLFYVCSYIAYHMLLIKQHTQEPYVLKCMKHYETLASKRYTIPLIVIVYLFFAVNIALMQIIPLNRLGIYGAALASGTIIVSIHGYYQCVRIFQLLRDLKKGSYSKPPHKEEWFISIKKLTKEMSIYFSILALGYILEISVLSYDYLTNTDRQCDLALILVWIGIVLSVAVVFPTLVILMRKFLADIQKKWEMSQSEKPELQ